MITLKRGDRVAIIESPYVNRTYWNQIGVFGRIISVFPGGHAHFVSWNGPHGRVYEVGYNAPSNSRHLPIPATEARDLFHELELIKICK